MSDRAIAVIGMACKFPGADSVDEFWQLLESGSSTTREVPQTRFSTSGRGHVEGKQFYGNWISDVDDFDHRFFKKSGREATSMDPQQRLLLQVSYQALESAGYFGCCAAPTTDVGCFVGACASDYNDNVTGHESTAFSNVGTLRAFLTGRIIHFFGWTGPAVTVNTACSSSTVAIDSACKAVLYGQCFLAIAGGVSIFTSPYFFQNLAAVSFLSPTGGTKSFDADADGYTRGEGVGVVVLKKLADASRDSDTILGVIAASAVNQSSNETTITAPHCQSQANLYRRVLRLANIAPNDVSFVEAHGSGTIIGDPIELEAIREVFGGPNRRQTLYFGSVKGAVGHTEGASGVAGLIKVLLMMQRRPIPPQANFRTLNRKVSPLKPDNMVLSTSLERWSAMELVACVNNYRAAGSIAAMIVQQPPSQESRFGCQTAGIARSHYPVFISGIARRVWKHTAKFCAGIFAEFGRGIRSIELLK